MIEIVTTAESVEQANALLEAGVNTLYIGNDEFGLRLPKSFTNEEIIHITNLAHEQGRTVCVAVNGLMHNDHIKEVVPYLQFLKSAKVDSITVGDPGVIHLLRKHEIDIPFIYDAQTLVISAKHINFWTKRGSAGAVLARELTFPELKEIAKQVTVPIELLVYGATCIHHSKRPLVENYFNFVEEDIPEKEMFVSKPKKPETHYSIYEDINGTHVFATDDINLLPFLPEIFDAGLRQWKLDGIFTRGEQFVEIANLFITAKEAITNQSWTKEQMDQWNEKLISLHPAERTLNEGFFLKDPSEVQ